MPVTSAAMQQQSNAARKPHRRPEFAGLQLGRSSSRSWPRPLETHIEPVCDYNLICWDSSTPSPLLCWSAMSVSLPQPRPLGAWLLAILVLSAACNAAAQGAAVRRPPGGCLLASAHGPPQVNTCRSMIFYLPCAPRLLRLPVDCRYRVATWNNCGGSYLCPCGTAAPDGQWPGAPRRGAEQRLLHGPRSVCQTCVRPRRRITHA